MARSMDPSVWKACAGSTVKIPSLDSLVYYFPQGHAEQASAVPDFSSSPCKFPLFTCRISGIQFLANQETDEVYAKMSLEPQNASATSPPPSLRPESSSGVDTGGEDGGVVSFAKILTASDANNGGGFSVPRFCADLIFPPLNLKEETPVQVVSIRDVHGTAWQFRHIYRGTPRRHLLTTGWSMFVNSKRLVAGDSIVFMKNRSGELFLGVRRTGRSGGGSPNFMGYAPQIGAASAVSKPEGSSSGGAGFSRDCRGRVPPETVVEAVRLAEKCLPFEVMYYPMAGLPVFVVRKDEVDAAIRLPWITDMRVKMAVETEDSSRMTWFEGKVSRVLLQDVGPFPPSPWRMLEVTWDEPEVLQNVRSVCPWKVEIVSTSSQFPSSYAAIKKPRLSQNEDFSEESEKNMSFPTSGITNMMTGSINQSLLDYNIFPAGMQGARHDSICESRLSNSIPNANKVEPNGNSALNVGNHSMDHFSKSVCKITKKVLKLFGQTIYLE